MMFSKALYYPTIDISDEDWLKTAYLFWDGIRTIVPESMADSAYRNNTTMYLAEEGFLGPIVVGAESKILRPLVKVVKKYAQTEEGMACLNQRAPEDVYINPYDDERSQFYLHHEKLPFEVQELVADKMGRDGWARVSDNFADFYMALLANRIASQRSLELLTPSSPLSDLAAGFSAETYHQPYSLARSRNEALGRSMLTKMVIDGITIDPLTSIDDLRIFKERHQTELHNFREGFDEISKMELPPDITIEGLEQRARDIYETKFLGAYRDLQESLNGFGIHFLVGGMGTIAFSDVSTCFNELLNGLEHPVQLTIGAGALLAYKGYKTVCENRDIKRKHKMSYMLAIERELGRK
jgi:hypothetical protein